MRLKRIAMGLLLCLALGLTLFAAVQAVQAVGRFALSRRLALSGDVRTIRPWMTLPYIARVYHVPESYLLQSLDITDASSVRHLTLSTIAARRGESTTTLIQRIQTAILTYRRQHPTRTPSVAPRRDSGSPDGRMTGSMMGRGRAR